MAQMIPAEIDHDTKSSAEKKLFKLFRDMPDTDDWYVLHSVGIARHPTQAQGEADFVVIFPNGGLFVLEVKGGRISYEDGVWYSTNRFDACNPIKNPISEANDAMHSLIEYIGKHDSGALRWCLCGFGVIFPDSTVHGHFVVPDLDDYQIADIDDMSDLKSYLLRLAGFWKSRKNVRVFVPQKQQVNELVSLIRPSYHFKPSISSQIRTIENQIIALTDEQRTVFDGLRDNDRCLIRGSAGTGKTVLAMEAARIFASQGQRVGLFCYNRNLAKWLQENIRDDESIVCGSLLDYMEAAIFDTLEPTLKQVRTEDSSKYYSEILPRQYAEYLLATEQVPFDMLIIDEAQDVFQANYLETIDFMLKGGIKDGQWYFFLDADKQNLYFAHMNYDEVVKALKGYGCGFTNYSLTVNCRNSQAIIEKIDSIFGVRTKYISREIRGADVIIRYYKKKLDQIEIAEQLIRQLVRDGLALDDIVVLSFFRLEKSVANVFDADFPISDEFNNRKGKILFSTVHSFKGLESPVVLLVDLENLDYEQQMNLLYVGMTRARSALYMIASNKAYHTLNKRIQEEAKNGKN